MEAVKRELYLFANFAFCISVTSSLLNIEELHDTKYGLEISSKPVLLKEAQDINTLLLASKHGQQYQCTLPEIVSPHQEEEEMRQVATEEVAKLLQPMEKKCLFHNNGWWTYELCFGRQISQYHQEGNMVVGDKTSLGTYRSQTDWSKEDVTLKGKPSKSTTKRFHSHFYVNGTECDLTGKPRETQVKFMCDKGSPDAVVRVDEPSTCSYVFTVATTRLCSNPLFKPLTEEKLHPITCSPALPQHHLDIYLETVETKRKATEAKEKARAEAKKRRRNSDGLFTEEPEEPAKKKRKKKKRSELWPWQEPAVEADDEMWLDSNIDKDTVGVHRIDITKVGRQDDPEGPRWGRDIISILSTKMLRSRPTSRPNTKVDETTDTGQTGQTGSEAEDVTSSDTRAVEDEKLSGEGSVQGGSREMGEGAGDGAQEMGKDESGATPSGGETEQGEKSGGQDAEQERSGGAPSGPETPDKPGGGETGRGKLESLIRKNLQDMGLDPNVLDRAASAIKRALPPEKSPENTEPTTGEQPETNNQETPDRHANPFKKLLDDQLDRLEKEGKLSKSSGEYLLLSGVRRLLEQMDAQNVDLTQEEEALIALLETHFTKARAYMDKAVEMVKKIVAQMEATRDDRTGVLDSLKRAIERYEESSRGLDEDLAAVKLVVRQLLAKIGEVSHANLETEPGMRADLIRLTSKAKHVQKQLLRRFRELNGEMRVMRRVAMDMVTGRSSQGEGTGGDDDTEGEVGGAEDEHEIDKVFDMITSMINGVGQKKKEPGGKEPSEKEGEDNDEEDDDDEEEDEDKDDGGGLDKTPDTAEDASGVRVRVTGIRKDGNPIWSEDDGEDLEDDSTATDVESRIRRATKQMENIMKEHLKNSGISLTGKVRVKIVTSREALENFDEGNGAQLLSDEETAQFKKMLVGVLGGGQEAGKERRRQMALEDNYNLVWDEKNLEKASREDDEEDVDELEVFTL